MLRLLFGDSPTVAVAIAALLFFLLTFIGAVLWTLSRRRTEHYRRMASLPVDEHS